MINSIRRRISNCLLDWIIQLLALFNPSEGWEKYREFRFTISLIYHINFPVW